ncbi:MAG: hypothetical protein B7Y88_11380 [Sphingomonadales bacterium 32-64-17]|nr:MAG: hypothetical protein B7Y88_11380 [Sphingomonadales bacterium 32-64-17]
MIRLLAIVLLIGTPLAAPARAQDDLALETAHLEDLTSIRQIKRLQARWGHLALAGNWQEMAAMATADARLVTRYGEITGRGGIAAWLKTVEGRGQDGIPAGRMNARLFLSPVITLAADGQSATGRWHEIAMTAEVGGEAGWLGVTHVIDYRKSGEGWQIAQIRPYEHFEGSYADGWSHDAETLERAPYHYTPDEAGELLPERHAAQPLSADRIAKGGTQLLLQSLAENTVAAYGYYLDRGLYDDIVDLFAEDATIEQGGEGSWHGKDGARAFLTRFGGPGLDTGELNDRPQLMPMVSVAADGSSALVRNVELGMTGHHGGEGQWQLTMQTFLLRRDEAGHWQIALMHRNPIMRADYAAGWNHPLPAALPLSAAGEPTGTTRLGPVDFREIGYAIPALGMEIVTPASGEAQTLAPIPDALARAEAFDGAANVSNAYGYYIDQFDWPATAALFAENGWKELSYIGTFVTREHVLRSLTQRYGMGGPNDAFQAIHQKTQPYVTVLPDDPTRAFVRTRLFQFNSSSSGPGSWISGIYENQIVKEDGIWRIHGMDLDYVWLGDYATGWTGIEEGASERFAPSPEVLAAFAADAPLRGEVFAPYPAIRPMGFHFSNPVSGRAPEVQLQWSDGYGNKTAE